MTSLAVGVYSGDCGPESTVGGWKDHVHILFGLPVTTSVSDFMRIVKTNSSKWINEQVLSKENSNGNQVMELFLIPGVRGIK